MKHAAAGGSRSNFVLELEVLLWVPYVQITTGMDFKNLSIAGGKDALLCKGKNINADITCST